MRETLGTEAAGMRAFMHRELFDRIGMATADPRFDAAGNFIGSSTCYCSARDRHRWTGHAVLLGNLHYDAQDIGFVLSLCARTRGQARHE